MSLSDPLNFKQLNAELDTLCRRLILRTSKCKDPLLRSAIRDLAELCKMTNEECRRYLSVSTAEQNGCTSLESIPTIAREHTSLLHPALELRTLFQECKSKTKYVISLLNKVFLPGQEPCLEGTKTSTNYQSHTAASQDETPFAKTKKERIRELTETLYLPTLAVDIKRQIETLAQIRMVPDCEVEDAYKKFREANDICLLVNSKHFTMAQLTILKEPFYTNIQCVQ